MTRTFTVLILILSGHRAFGQFPMPIGFKKDIPAYGEEISGIGRAEFYTNGVYKMNWTSFGNSIAGRTATEELKQGLEMAFNGHNYLRTKDGLYYSTGQNACKKYYYIVYNPKSFCVNYLTAYINDEVFSTYSKWLLSQVRMNAD